MYIRVLSATLKYLFYFSTVRNYIYICICFVAKPMRGHKQCCAIFSTTNTFCFFIVLFAVYSFVLFIYHMSNKNFFLLYSILIYTNFFLQFKSEGPPPKRNPGELLLTSNNVRSLQDLHHFFSSLSRATCDTYAPINSTQLETVIEQDFLEKMPTVPAR